ncbi:MAG: threonine--tRNA ligase [Thiotrichaceae bacterium]
MPIITLPDGSQRSFEHSVTIAEVAASIGAGLAKAALAGKLNGRLCDTSTVITTNSTLSIVTEKDAEGLEIIRHSCAHLMAQAVKTLYPETQVTIGPMIEDGFYYDFARKEPFTTDDLVKIQAKMEELAKQDIPVSRSLMARDQAVDFFTQLGEKYKAEIIASIPSNEDLSLYQQAEFTDLCRGPHVPSTGKIKAFKLMKVAGAYWRGDAKNEMLQRIYGTAWANKKDLEAYLHRLEEAEKRDHRKLGKQLNLFHLQQEAPGMVFWHDRGWTVYVQIQNYIRNLLRQHGYQEVHTPQIVDRSLWEKSGHWDKFREEMFTTNSEERDYAVKPMNCPCHIQIYNQGLKSYRDLPLRLAEFGSCHRNEPSGALHGLMRLRNFVQDDAHIFCTEDQIQSEVSQFIDLLFKVYADFGFHDVAIKLSTRPEKRVGSDEIWDKAEKSLELALNHKNLAWQLQPGEGAFYGPKIEFSLKDSIGRVWQCGTIQVDFSMPARLGAEYVAADNSKQTPVMLHRAVLGSLERFIGILIENHAGALPTWLSPTQVVVLNITDKFAEYAESVVKKLRELGIRADIDLRNEKVNFKIREHTLQKVPYLLIVGQKEQETQQVAVRSRKGEDFGAMNLDAFLAKFQAEVNSYQ